MSSEEYDEHLLTPKIGLIRPTLTLQVHSCMNIHEADLDWTSWKLEVGSLEVGRWKLDVENVLRVTGLEDPV